MRVISDGWSPFFSELKGRVSSEGRKRLLFQMIGELQDISMLNIGNEDYARPSNWPALTKKYADAKKGGDTTPNLILTGSLRESFVHHVTDSCAILTNTADYADEHQFGVGYKNLPARPFYPVSPDGESLTPFAEERLLGVVVGHFAL